MMVVRKVEPTRRQAEKLDEAQHLSRRTQALLASAGMSEPRWRRWYVLTLEHGADIPVDNALTNAAIPHWMATLGIKRKRRSHRKFQTFCPLITPAFPGYMFVHVAWFDETWEAFKRVEGVVGVVGRPMAPAPLPDKEFQKFRLRAERDPQFIAELSNELKIGDDVRVDDGPFASFPGVVSALNPKAARVSIDVHIFGRVVPVDLDLAQITKVE